MNQRGFDLRGKVAIVTGASRGIGMSTALALAAAGSRVVLASRRLADLEQVAEKVRGAGQEALAVSTHMGHPVEVRDLVARTVDAFGRVDILVNNAASNPAIQPAEELEERVWDHVMNVNLKGVFLLSQEAGKVMIQNGGGSIINVASVGGLKPDRKASLPYEVSKAGVIMLTKALAGQWGKYNIRVNAVAPGLIVTRTAEHFWSDESTRQQIMGRMSLGRLGKPEDIASVILFLASDQSAFVTGCTIVADGGLLLG